jgi:hypothetical protein
MYGSKIFRVTFVLATKMHKKEKMPKKKEDQISLPGCWSSHNKQPMEAIQIHTY